MKLHGSLIEHAVMGTALGRPIGILMDYPSATREQPIPGRPTDHPGPPLESHGLSTSYLRATTIPWVSHDLRIGYCGTPLHFHPSIIVRTVLSKLRPPTPIFGLNYWNHVCIMHCSNWSIPGNTHTRGSSLGIHGLRRWRAHGLSRNKPWGTHVPSINTYQVWAILALPYAAHGLLIDFPWAAHGPSLQHSQAAYGLPMVCQRPLMVYTWTTNELLVVHLQDTHATNGMRRATRRLCMDCPWTIVGLGTHGFPMSYP